VLIIPNLTYDEVNEIFKWYEKESNQRIDQNVIDRIYYEFIKGQPCEISGQSGRSGQS